MAFLQWLNCGCFEDVEILDFEIYIDLRIGLPVLHRRFLLRKLELAGKHDWQGLLLREFSKVVVVSGCLQLAIALALDGSRLLIALPQLYHPEVFVEVVAIANCKTLLFLSQIFGALHAFSIKYINFRQSSTDCQGSDKLWLTSLITGIIIRSILFQV